RVDRLTFRRWLIGLAATSPGARGARHVLVAMRHMFEVHMRLTVHEVDLSVAHGDEAFADVPPGSVAPLVRADAVVDAEAFVDGYVAALDTWVAAVGGQP